MTTPATPAPKSAQWLIVVALCPAVAVSDTLGNAIGLGIVALISCVIVSLATASLRTVPATLRDALLTMILAASVSCIALWMDAWVHDLHGSLGIFLPLLVANFAVLWRPEQTPRSLTNEVMLAIRTGLATLMTLLLLGIARELVGRGSLLHDASWTGLSGLQLFPADMGFLLAMLPPGAFIAFGLLLAARNWFLNRPLHESGKDR